MTRKKKFLFYRLECYTVDAFVMKKCWERIDGDGPENYYEH